ncbi:hypothetical protein LZ30DRAFT_808836 [Colletotrichum cereale]|nr:hypothetical protein LZ30DRAFT_808836 [Colletotrichum cereale]
MALTSSIVASLPKERPCLPQTDEEIAQTRAAITSSMTSIKFALMDTLFFLPIGCSSNTPFDSVTTVSAALDQASDPSRTAALLGSTLAPIRTHAELPGSPHGILQRRPGRQDSFPRSPRERTVEVYKCWIGLDSIAHSLWPIFTKTQRRRWAVCTVINAFDSFVVGSGC